MTTTLVYGRSPHGYLTIVPRADADAAAQRIREVFAATTVGEARRLDAPGVEDDDADSAPFDIRESGLVEDGDWPPSAGMLAVETLPREVRELLAAEHSMAGQEWVEMPTRKRLASSKRSVGWDTSSSGTTSTSRRSTTPPRSDRTPAAGLRRH